MLRTAADEHDVERVAEFNSAIHGPEVGPLIRNLGFDAALATLQHLKTLVMERDKPGIRLNLPADCTLMRLARSLGAHDLGTCAWQIHVPDLNALLRALAPVLERRIAESPFAGLTRDVRLSLYRETIGLRFVAGRLTEVANLGFISGEPIRFPPVKVHLAGAGVPDGGGTARRLPDVSIAPAWRLLVDTLFPKVTSFIYTIY